MELLNSDPQIFVRFAWTVQDGEYTYMDTWDVPQDEWNAMTPETIEARQREQYAKWREYMANPGS